MQARINLFFAWFFIPLVLMPEQVFAVGRYALEMLGVVTQEGDIPGRMVGALLLLAVVYLVQHFRGSLPPAGKPEGNGFLLGYRVVLAANLLAFMLLLFPFAHYFQLIESRNVVMVLGKLAIIFGYVALAGWAVGFSFLYQSSLPEKQ